MIEETASLVQYLQTIVGKYSTIVIFGRSLDPKEGLGAFLRDIVLEDNTITLDFTDNEGFLILKICDIESYFAQEDGVNIFARSVELEWCFAPREYWERIGKSTWKMEKVDSFDKGDVIDSRKYTAWDKKLGKEKFASEAPAAFMKTQLGSSLGNRSL